MVMVVIFCSAFFGRYSWSQNFRSGRSSKETGRQMRRPLDLVGSR